MRKLILLLLTVTLFLSAAAADPKFLSRIDVQKGEKWWGLYLSASSAQPFESGLDIKMTELSPASNLVSMMVSSSGRYIYSDEPLTVMFDGNTMIVGSNENKVQAEKAGKTLREAYLVCCHKNFPPTGHTPDTRFFTAPVYELPLDRGPIQSQAEVLDYADRIIAEGLPVGTIVINDGWKSVGGTLTPDAQLFPDPAALVGQLKSKGFRVLLTVTPYLPAYGKAYVEARKNGWLLTDVSGEALVVSGAGGFSAVYDVTDPAVRELYAGAFENINNTFPVDGYRFDCRMALRRLEECRTDAAEYLSAWMALGTGMPAALFIPSVPDANHASLRDIRPDYDTNTSDLAAVVNAMVSAGLCGYPYLTTSALSGKKSDVVGDERKMAENLLLQACMPVMNVMFSPWNFTDAGLRSAVAAAFRFRESVSAYLEELVSESSRTAEPLVRHMEYQFPRNGFADCDDQFMLGPRYLIAPCTGGMNSRLVRLPKGNWADRDGKRYKGPLVMEAHSPDGFIYFEHLAK